MSNSYPGLIHTLFNSHMYLSLPSSQKLLYFCVAIAYNLWKTFRSITGSSLNVITGLFDRKNVLPSDSFITIFQVSGGSQNIHGQRSVNFFSLTRSERSESSPEVDSFNKIRWLPVSDGVGNPHVLRSQGFASRGRGLHRVWYVSKVVGLMCILFRFFI